MLTAPIPDEVSARASALALECYRAIGCRGFGRVDMLLDPDGGLWVLELNAIPGMTDTSLLPAEFRERAAGQDEAGRARVVADYVAGMTDRYAIAEHERLLG